MEVTNVRDRYQTIRKMRTSDLQRKPLSPDCPIKINIERDALSKYRDKWEMLLANA